ncbi:MAG TPA: glycoside hydrolase family 5 protein [Rhizomicrobium sp.]
MTRTLAAFSAAIALAAMSAGAARPQAEVNPPFADSFAPLDAYAQTATMHRGMNVLGFDPMWDDPARARFKMEYFGKLRDAGFDTVRLVLKPFDHMDASDNIDSAWLATLDRVLMSALAAGLTPIVDLHYNNECGDDAALCEHKVLAFWRQIAPRYRNAPARVVFEILNEPHGVLTAPVWNNLMHKALAVIRESNPERNVIVGPAGWNSIDQLPDLELPTEDQHIIATVHYYWPMTFTHQGAPWVKETKNLSGITWGTAADWQKLYRNFDGVKAWSDAHHRPIFLGEFGAYDKGDLASRMRYDNYVARAAEAHGFPWAYWQFDSDFIAYDIDHDRWVEPILESLIPPGGTRTSSAP